MSISPAYILLIEDEEFALEMIAKALSKKGYQVKSVLDSHEAKIAIDAQSFDLIITDIMLPHLGGFDIIEYVKDHALNGATPILVQTGIDKDILLATDMQANAVLTKPYEMSELIAKVEELIDESVV
jgi:two-component system, sensor histidine kinase ChiS